MVSFVTVLVRFVRAVASSWRDPEFRGLFTLVVVTLHFGTLFYRRLGVGLPGFAVFQRRHPHHRGLW